MSERAKTSRRGGGVRLKVRGPRDFYGGLALIALALVSFWALADLPGQEGFAFGPGTAPRLVAGLLLAVGVVIAINGLLFSGPPIESFAVQGPAFVVVGIIVFAVMIRGMDFTIFSVPLRVPSFGLVISTFCAFMISIMGSREMRWVESLLTAAGMTVFCVLLFVTLLKLPFDLCPSFLPFCTF
jgi:putative tricarboxylic transport membrane protein